MLQPSPSTKITSLVACLVAQVAVGSYLARAADGAEPPAGVKWHGTTGAFHRQLSASVGLTWRANPIRNAVFGLARSQRIAMFLDRRVDPNRQIDFSVQGVTLEDALHQFATANDLSVSYVGTVVYLGPPSVADRLAALVETRNNQLALWPSDMRRRLNRRRPWSWPMLAEPRHLLEQLSQDSGIQIQGIDQLPHDLWPAADLPPMTFAQRLTLVLAGFDRTFEFLSDKRCVRIVPFPEEVTLRRTYRIPREASTVIAELSQLFPAARVDIKDSGLVVEGRLDDLDRISRFLLSQPTRKPAPVEKDRRFTLRVVNKSAEALLNRLSSDLSLSVDVDRSASQTVKETISVEVTNATLDELLSAALRPLGLNHELRGTQLTIYRRAIGSGN